MNHKRAGTKSRFSAKVFVLLAGIAIVSFTLLSVLPQRSDWSAVYRPASLNLIAGKSPYDIPYYVAPPWLLIPLVPLAIAPERVGRLAIFWLSLASYAYLAKRNRASLLSMVALILSYPVIYGLIYGQVDCLVILGLVLPPWLGLILLMAKPQLGIGVAIFIGFEAWAKGGVRRLISTSVPIVAVAIVSFLAFGPNLFEKASLVLAPTNTSLWPRSLPIGLVVLVSSLRHKAKWRALAASPFLSPYMPVHSWASAIVGLSDDRLYPTLISIGSWIVWALGGGAVNG